MERNRSRAIVCGAGTAGLAAAATLKRAGVDVLILERADRVGASWRARYAALRLNTPGWMCTQPGYRATRRRYGEFPSRDQWIAYLEDYAAHHELEVRFGAEVRRIERAGDAWQVHTADEVLDATVVVVATGFDHDPYMPDWPGREGFTGELLHAADYSEPEPYRDRDVLVVGPGVTGTELAFHISEAGAARVRVASRTPPHFYRRKLLGAPPQIAGIALHHLPLRVADALAWSSERMVFGDLTPYGLPRPPQGAATVLAEKHQAPACDDGFIDAVKAGEIEIVAAVEGFDGADVLLADESRIQPDVVIAATGYRRGLEPLVAHLGVLDERGLPLAHGGRQHPEAPGLYFTGFRGELSGQLRLMRFDARAIGRSVRRRQRASAQVP
jgi:putative flavoprotein involved in K+ transport